jgi:HPt (histidine-containing phosphotransfer) domain-containing protein
MSDDKIMVTVDADLEDLIPGFLENRAKELETLRAALRDGNFQSLQSIGHSMKGVGGGYGFDGITDIGRDLENTAKLQDLEGISALIEKYADYLERIEVNFE